MKSLLLVLCALPLAPVLADNNEVRLDWMTEGFFNTSRYYSPKVTTFLSEKPAQIVKAPEGLMNPQYVLLETGPKSTRKLLGLILDQRSPKEAHMWLDANGDGDLTNDPEVKWEPSVRGSGEKESISWHGEAKVQVQYPDSKQDMMLFFYRNAGSKGPGALIYRRDYGRAGKISLDGKELAAYLSDDSTTGEFTLDRSRLGIDLNADKRFDMKTEGFPLGKPFQLLGTVYEVKNLAADGSRFELVRSDKTVEQLKEAEKSATASKVADQRQAQESFIGKPAPSFEAKTIDGKTVRFPQDYKGKLVMLDFWATWCGPCLHELPGVIKVHDEFAAKGFTVLGISLDSEDAVSTLPAFLKDRGMSWPQVCDGDGWQCRIARQYGVRGIPSCWLIDGDTGNIVATSVDLRGAALRGTVEQALANLGKEIKPRTARTSATPPAAKTPAADATPNPIVALVQKMAAEEALTSAKAFQSQLAQPVPASLELASPATMLLRGREIAKRAADSHVRVGWVFQCTKCDRWHTNLAGGYAIAPDVVATAHHVVAPPANMKPGVGYPVIIRGEKEVLNITSVLFADESGDTAILRVSAKDLKPLALSHDVQVGDTAYCFSDPRDVIGHFSSGLVNRLHSPAKPAGPMQQRMDVSADWAPGSSGSAILDDHGNVLGHVARIRPLFGEPRPAAPAGSSAPALPPTLMTLNEAVPASVVLSLIEKKPAQ
ncbi:redoxin domain-containing protein [Prosthecobacter sp.]|uniref:redoxin domain-containing protein n=1 Tax=Prosthecobacter sp. TaxID=1965333 RepID=UPI003784E1DC